MASIRFELDMSGIRDLQIPDCHHMTYRYEIIRRANRAIGLAPCVVSLELWLVQVCGAVAGTGVEL